nr:YkgJ family cysteine cluster protein [uncultured Desulfobulbus sp.]
MPRSNTPQTDLEDTATWKKYSAKLCTTCNATCCSLPVEIQAVDLVRMGLMESCEQEGDLKFVARRLMKKRVIEHFHHKSGTFTLARMANGDCIYLDPQSRRCTIYDKRPDTCRNHPRIGPRSGFCAFTPRKAA